MDLEPLRLLQKVGTVIQSNDVHPSWIVDCGRKLVHISEDADTYINILERSESFPNQYHPSRAGFIQASEDGLLVLRKVFEFLSSNSDVQRNEALISRVNAYFQSLPTSGTLASFSMGDRLSVDLPRFRHYLSETFKLFKLKAIRSHQGMEFVDPIQPILTVFRNYPPADSINTLTDLYSTEPFPVGGPALSSEKISRINQSVSLFNTDVSRLEDKMLEEGRRRWFRDGSTEELRRMQLDLMEAFWATTLDQARRIPEQDAQDYFRKLENLLRRTVTRPATSTFRVAVIGVVNSGKSTFLNCIIGKPILPSGNAAVTAWPCLIRHERGKIEPEITCDPEPFNDALRLIRLDAHANGSHGDSLEEFSSDTWVNEKLWDDSWTLARTASGIGPVQELLADINYIFRICRRSFDDGTASNSWPEIVVEFQNPPGDANVRFEFMDVPGLAEEGNRDTFQRIASKVADYCDAVVPIVNALDVNTEQPPFTEALHGHSIDLVVCTRLDALSELDDERIREVKERQRIFADKFGVGQELVVVCSPRHGLGAQMLLSKSSGDIKPQIDRNVELEFSTMLRCCGTERNFNSSSPAQFYEDLRDFHRNSEIPSMLHKLQTDVFQGASKRRLFRESQFFREAIKKLAEVQTDNLNDALGGYAELEDQRQEFESFIDQALNDWNSEERQFIHDRTSDSWQSIKQKPDEIAKQTLEKVRRRWLQAEAMKMKYDDDGEIKYVFKDSSNDDLKETVDNFFQSLNTTLAEDLKSGLSSVMADTLDSAYRDRIGSLKHKITPHWVAQSATSLDENLSLNAMYIGNMEYDKKKYGPGMRDVAGGLGAWSAGSAIASIGMAGLGSALVLGAGLFMVGRWIFKKNKISIKENELVSELQRLANDELNRILHSLEKKLEDAIKSATSDGNKIADKVLSDKNLEYRNVLRQRFPEVVEMLIVFCNLQTTAAAAEAVFREAS